MTERALCSVIVPAYNCEATVRESVESALQQTYAPLEVLIVNDASTDGTRSVLAQLAKEDARVTVTNLEKNRGVAEARNLLFEQASGDYVAFLDSDDIWYEEKLERQISLLQKKDVDLVYSSYAFIDGEGKSIGSAKIVPPDCTLKALLKENYILPSTVVMKSSWAKRYRMDGSYSHEDFVYWLAMMQDGLTAAGNSDVLIDYRLFESNRSGNKAKAARDRWIVYRRFLKMNVFVSTWYFFNYAINGFKKYRGL